MHGLWCAKAMPATATVDLEILSSLVIFTFHVGFFTNDGKFLSLKKAAGKILDFLLKVFDNECYWSWLDPILK